MRHFIANVISTFYSLIRFSLMKLFYLRRFHFFPIQRFSPNVIISMSKGSTLRLGKTVRAHSGCRFASVAGGHLQIDENCKFNYNCVVVCRHSVHIQKGVEFGPNVLIYDHDHDFRAEGGLKAGKFKNSPVVIGEDSWIGANVVILRGTTIGKNCVIGAGCVVKGDIPDNTLVVQKKETEFISLSR